MKKRNKILILLTAIALMVGMTAAPVMAKSSSYNGKCYFNGAKIVSDFSSSKIADKVTALQPGDKVQFKVKYTNKYGKKTNWYLSNEVLQTLEKADAARKVPKGTGTPENGGYTYSLIHTDKKGKKTTIFSNEKVGGEAKPAKMEGLEQATNATKDWFFIQTLDKGESGELELTVAFEGETEVNDYMDTDGGLALRFAVDLNTAKADNPDEPDNPVVSTPQTGDNSSMLIPFLIMLAAGTALLILVFARLRRRDEETGGNA